MITKRLFYIFIGVALVLLAVLTVKDAVATRILAGNNSEAAGQAAIAKASNADSALSRSSAAERSRWDAQANQYAAKAAPLAAAVSASSTGESQRSLAADSARLTAMSKGIGVTALARSSAAEGARWDAMASYYAAKVVPAAAVSASIGSVSQRSLTAEAARLTAMSKVIGTMALGRSSAAEGARWNAMASYYAAKTAPVTAAAPTSSGSVSQRSLAAEAARWAAMANSFAGK